jgi:hypothetical protein
MRSGNLSATDTTTATTATLTGDHFTSNGAIGGASGDASTGGAAIGGAVYINVGASQTGTVKLSDNTFDANSVLGGSGRDGGLAEGGSLAVDASTSISVQFDVSNTRFTGGEGPAATGGHSLGGDTAGNGGAALGGAVALLARNSTGASFDLEQVTCEDTLALGGECLDSTDGHAPFQQGGNAYGGGVYYLAGAATSPHLVVNSCHFTHDTAEGGSGGIAPAQKNNRGRPDSSFAGGDANGGGLAIVVERSDHPSFFIAGATLFQQCTALGGTGGEFTDYFLPPPNFFYNGGPGGKALGGGMLLLNGPSVGASLDARGCIFSHNSAIGGAGGQGGVGGTGQNGGTGGNGGAASGGGLEIQRIGGNPGPGKSLAPFTAVVVGSSFTANKAQGGAGGDFGRGAMGGQGGTGGRAQGGGVCIEATNGNPADRVILSGDFFGFVAEPLLGNVAQGGAGGSNEFAPNVQGGQGGQGGLGEGGGVSSRFSGTVLMENSTIAWNSASGGKGGQGGVGGSNGPSNMGFGGGVKAFSYTIGGKDEQTSNLFFFNTADVDPDVEGKLIHI